MILSSDAAGGIVTDPRDPTQQVGGGGSRAGYMGLTRAMGRLGKYRVVAVSTFKDRKLELGGVTYVPLTKMHEVDVPDVCFAFYDTMPLVGSPAKLRIASHHTLTPFHTWNWNDVNVAPNRWTAEWLKRQFRPYGEWRVVSNAVEGLEGVVRDPKPGRVVYHGSPDRGAHLLLANWHLIREAVPEATLHLTGDVEEVMAWADNPMFTERDQSGKVTRTRCYEASRAVEMRAALERADRAGGLKLLGRLSRPALLRQLAQAEVFAYPCEVAAPCETWSVSVHECLALGVPVVLSPVDALYPQWGDAVAVHMGDARDGMPDFCRAVVDVLKSPELRAEMAATGRKAAAEYSFDRSARELDAVIEEFLP
jgi:glycosyltransferase involved in cell wall biosynthesis